MFPNGMHLVPSEYVQVKHFTDRQRALQNKIMVDAKRQHEDLQEDMSRSNLWRRNQ